MDAFQWWVNLWNPIAKPTADLATEAERMYQAGEIDWSTYQDATGKAALLAGQITNAQEQYEAYAKENSLDPVSVLKPVTDLTKNLMILLAVGAAVYLLIEWKRLEA